MHLRRKALGLLLPLFLLSMPSTPARAGGKTEKRTARRSAGKADRKVDGRGDRAKRIKPAPLALVRSRETAAAGDKPAATEPAARRTARGQRTGAAASRPLSRGQVAVRGKKGGARRAKTGDPRPASRSRRDRWPPMKLETVNSRARATLRLYDGRGRVQRAAVRKIWSLMRCHVTGTQRPIHWRLIRNLYRISRHYAGKTIYIYSGYRSRKVASLRSSNHVKGRAVDLRVEGVSNRALRDYLMTTFRPAGVGYYPNGSFIHFDIREKQSAFWVDYSGKGEAAEYATNPYAILKQEKQGKDQTARTTTGPSRAPQAAVADTAGSATAPRAAAALGGPITPAVQPVGSVIGREPAPGAAPLTGSGGAAEGVSTARSTGAGARGAGATGSPGTTDRAGSATANPGGDPDRSAATRPETARQEPAPTAPRPGGAAAPDDRWSTPAAAGEKQGRAAP